MNYSNLSNITGNCTEVNCSQKVEQITRSSMQYILIACYAVICVLGLLGNGLVIYVVLRHAKMKTVTNMYILNLAVADVLFLLGLPFLMITTYLTYWVFGQAMCKIFFVSYSINWFTSVFTLTLMSADRYLAVCYPVQSLKYRTQKIARISCLCIWLLSITVMLPIIIYANTIDHIRLKGKHSCIVTFPESLIIPADQAFTWYSLLLGFAIPVPLISVFYFLVVFRLRSVGPARRSKEMTKSHRKVTRMVLAVISVYVICWLPYWIFQVHLSLAPKESKLGRWAIYLFNVITVLSYTNSMLNPVLYAFLSENFRKSFAKAFRCLLSQELASKMLLNQNFEATDNRKDSRTRNMSRDMSHTETYELTTANNFRSASVNRIDNLLSPDVYLGE